MVLRTAPDRAVVFTERGRAGELWDDAERAGDSLGLGHVGAAAVDRLPRSALGRWLWQAPVASAGARRRNGMGLYGGRVWPVAPEHGQRRANHRSDGDPDVAHDIDGQRRDRPLWGADPPDVDHATPPPPYPANAVTAYPPQPTAPAPPTSGASANRHTHTRARPRRAPVVHRPSASTCSSRAARCSSATSTARSCPARPRVPLRRKSTRVTMPSGSEALADDRDVACRAGTTRRSPAR